MEQYISLSFICELIVSAESSSSSEGETPIVKRKCIKNKIKALIQRSNRSYKLGKKDDDDSDSSSSSDDKFR